MGLLDQIVSAVGSQLGQQMGNQMGGDQMGGAQGQQLIAMVLQQLGGGQGLGGLVEQFSRGGLGDVVQSWIGKGQNMGISAEQIGQILGGGQLAQLAQQFGLQPDQLAAQLAEQLPGAVDQLTPQGELPSGSMEDLLGSLSGMLRQR